MLRVLNDIASGLGARSGFQLGEPATSVPVRRINSSVLHDDKAYSGQATEKQAESFRGTVYAAVDKIARRIAQLELNLFTVEVNQGDEDVKEKRVLFHPFTTLFSSNNGHKPHEEFNTWELKYTISASLDTTGEAWCLIERDSLGRPSRITPLPAYRMVVVMNKDTGLTAGYLYVPKNQPMDKGIFFPKRTWADLHRNKTEPFIWYCRYPSPRGIEDPRGWSPVKAAAYAYDINLYEQIYKRNFLQQGAQLGGILQSETALSRQQIEEYMEQFQNRHGGYEKSGLPLILPKMLKWTTTEPTPRDMQWAEAVNLTQSQILQIYGISDAKLGRADIGNRNTADAMDVTFNREVIQSRCDHLTASLNADFIPIYPQQNEKLYFTVRFDDPVPADSEALMNKEKQDIELNIITRNEVREARKKKKFGKFGDQVFMPLTHVAMDPNAATLELSQDDANKLGFEDPEEKLKMEEKYGKNKQEGSGKKDGLIDPKEDQKAKEAADKLKEKSVRFTVVRNDEGQIVEVIATQ